MTHRLEPDGTVSALDIALSCFPEEDNQTNSHHYTIYSVCVLVSSFFLLITLLVYLLVPELRDLQGKCLMFSMFSLCLAYISLAVLQLYSHNLSNTMCVSQGKGIYHCLWLCSISQKCWLNKLKFNLPLFMVVLHIKDTMMQYTEIQPGSLVCEVS